MAAVLARQEVLEEEEESAPYARRDFGWRRHWAGAICMAEEGVGAFQSMSWASEVAATSCCSLLRCRGCQNGRCGEKLFLSLQGWSEANDLDKQSKPPGDFAII